MTSPVDLFPPPWLGEWLPRTGADEPSPITFPASQLATRVRIALGADFTSDPSTWLWEDISQYVRYADGITVSCGRADWASTADTKRAELRLDNTGGRFVRRNPSSPYFGKLSKNSPIWIEVNPGSGWITRFQGFVSEWPTRWADKSGRSSSVPIVCAGVLRRLSQNTYAPSAIRRTRLSRSPLAYWPMEAGSGPIIFGSAISGNPPLTIIGTASSSAGGPDGSDTLADFSGGMGARFAGPSTTSTSWSVQFVFMIPATLSNTILLAQWSTTGDATTWQVYANPIGLGGLSVAYIQNGTTHGASSSRAVDDGQWHHLRLDAQSSSFTYELWLDGTGAVGSGATGINVGQITTGTLNPNRVTSIAAMGHLALEVGLTSLGVNRTGDSDAVGGYVGEQAHERLSRLCDEANIPFVYRGNDGTPTMGPQLSSPFVSLLRECETAGQGLLYEDAFGIGYQDTNARYNAPVGLSLDFNQGHIGEIPEPADDDQLTKNRWTVSRSDGTDVTVADADSVAADGAYDASIAVNVDLDTLLGHQAGWRVRLGTADEDRWPNIAMNFARAPDLIPDWAVVQLGQRLNAVNPPAEMPPDAIDAFVEGWSERFDSRSWTVDLFTSPASPYDVGTLSDGTSATANRGWLQFTSCVLAADVDTTAASWSVTCSPADTSSAACFPRPHRIGGEVVTVTASTGGTSPTWTVTRSVNGVVKGHSANDAIALSRPLVLSLS